MFGDMGALLKQAKEMKSNAARIQKELRQKTVEGRAGGDAVVVTVSGDGELLSLKISPELVASGDTGKIEKLIQEAVSNGLRASKKLMKDELTKVTGGLNLPGLNQMLGGL